MNEDKLLIPSTSLVNNKILSFRINSTYGNASISKDISVTVKTKSLI